MYKHFQLITYQNCISFMFDREVAGKLKNDKIIKRRRELPCHSYDIFYRSDKQIYATATFAKILKRT